METILVTGGTGLVGSTIKRVSKNLMNKFEISRWYYCNNSQFPCKKNLF